MEPIVTDDRQDAASSQTNNITTDQHHHKRRDDEAGLRHTLAGIKRSVKLISPTEMPNLGRDFLRALYKASPVLIIPDPQKESTAAVAAYIPFTFSKDNKKSFTNGIKYNPDARKSEGKLTLSFLHESFHAIQYNTIPALHLSGYNLNTPVMITPLDSIIINCLAERAAITFEAAMGFLLKPAYPHIDERSNLHALSTEEFKDIYQQAPDIKSAFKVASRQALNKHHSNNHGSFEDYYTWQALNNYERNLNFRTGNKFNMPLIVQLENSDIQAFCDALGHPIMDCPDIDELRRTTLDHLSTQNRAKLEQVEEFLLKVIQINSFEHVPTLSNSLQYHNYTPSTFLEASKADNLLPFHNNQNPS